MNPAGAMGERRLRLLGQRRVDLDCAISRPFMQDAQSSNTRIYTKMI